MLPILNSIVPNDDLLFWQILLAWEQAGGGWPQPVFSAAFGSKTRARLPIAAASRPAGAPCCCPTRRRWSAPLPGRENGNGGWRREHPDPPSASRNTPSCHLGLSDAFPNKLAPPSKACLWCPRWNVAKQACILCWRPRLLLASLISLVRFSFSRDLYQNAGLEAGRVAFCIFVMCCAETVAPVAQLDRAPAF